MSHRKIIRIYQLGLRKEESEMDAILRQRMEHEEDVKNINILDKFISIMELTMRDYKATVKTGRNEQE